jgi:hypothetical protein
VIEIRNPPQEEQRLQVPRAFLERTAQDLNDHVQGSISELIFNFDQVGISDWQDRKPKKVVPAAMFDQTIDHGVSRNLKSVSVIACALAAGQSLLLYIVTSLNSSLVQGQLKMHDVCFGRDLTLKFHQKPHINVGIFLDYVRTVFLPYLVSSRGLAEFV